MAESVDPSLLAREIAALPPSQRLLSASGYHVYAAWAPQIPLALREIGRLRELSFRQVHEGTGRPSDLDRFDSTYCHLFLWRPDCAGIAGAYRLCGADSKLPLYSSTLFRFQPDFLRRIYPALELGRSFIHPAYQKGFAPLLLLWRGIGEFLCANPRYRYLFGPVSISADYSAPSRLLITAFLDHRFRGSPLYPLVKPARQFKPWIDAAPDLLHLASKLESVEELSEVVSSLEPDGKGIPVLLRQYLNLGAQVLSFSLDRAFSNAVDGLIVLDLLAMEPSQLTRYLGKDGSANFLLHHGLTRSSAAIPRT